MGNVKIIKAKQEMQNIKKLRVAAYCRVSTPSIEQEVSYKAQIKYYTEYIKSNKDWEYAGTFSDIYTGLSEERPGFQKMLRAAKKGKIELIITKSMSRFSRKVLDTLKNVEELRRYGVAIYFEKEGLWTDDENFSQMSIIHSLQAQEEGVAKGKNVRMGISYGFQRGDSGFADIVCYGYMRDDKGRLVINLGEAKVVKRIFQMYLNGTSINGIIQILNDEKILTSTGNGKWSTNVVSFILKNRKYTGDVILQKHFIENTLTGKIIRNCGERDQYLIEGHHNAIISQEQFEDVQAEMNRRSSIRGHYSSKPLSGLLYCGKCGHKYGPQKRKKKDTGEKFTVWRCYSNLKKELSKCSGSPTILEDDIKKSICDELCIMVYDDVLAKKTFSKILVQSDGTLSCLKND